MTHKFREGSKAAQIVARARAEKALTTADLAAAFGCSRQYIHAVLGAAGMKAAIPKRVWLPRKASPPPSSRVTPEGGGVQISSSATGSVSELLVAADLMSRGWSVFFPLYRARSDLIATSKNGETIKRFEVRSGKRRAGEMVYARKPTDAQDHYAVVLPGEPVKYVPPLLPQ